MVPHTCIILHSFESLESRTFALPVFCTNMWHICKQVCKFEMANT